MQEQEKKNRSEQLDTLTNVAQAGAATEVVQRYGSAGKEHWVAYSGVDNERGEQLKRGLKDIAKSKVNPNYKDTNIKQQAGYAAENKYTARQNAERIINKDKSRVHNTDVKGSGKYDPFFDHVITDKNGVVISQEQMKFVGNSPKSCLDKLASKKFKKYLDANAKITVPSDYYDGIIAEADKVIASTEEQLRHAQEQGNAELIQKLKERIAKYKKIRANVKNSGVSNKEAVEARLHPKLSTAKDIVKVSHRAGVEQAKYGAAIGGGMSLIRNVVAVVKGEKEPNEAALCVAKDTGQGAATAYMTAFAGSTIKGAMQNAGSKTTQVLAKTNLPGVLVTATVETSKTLKKYFCGEITGLDCLTELGEKGTSQLSAAMFATAGQLLIPIPVVGGMVGGLVGYALCSACYKELVGALQEAKLAHEERLRIEAECAEAIILISQYKKELDAAISAYLSDMRNTFDAALMQAQQAIWKDDIDYFISAANTMSVKLGRKPQFGNFSEFKTFMATPDALKL